MVRHRPPIHPGLRAAPAVRSAAVRIGVVLLGLALSLLLLRHAVTIPRPWLFAAERWAFWLILLAAVLARLARRHPAFAARESAAMEARSPITAAALAATFLLFSLPLAFLWASGRTIYSALGGLLPWSDAAAYFFGAQHLLDQGLIDQFNMRRPIVAAFLAVRLALTGGELEPALALQAWLTGAACFLAARAIARSHGLGSGLLALALLYEFARPHLGTTLSETLGLTFGCLAFAVLWAAAGRRSPPGAVLMGGAALLTLGLMARPGAYTSLAALIVWAALGFQPRPAWRAAAWTAAGVALGLLLNASLYWRFAGERGQANANFAYTLYGVTAGGIPWHEAIRDHPECWTPIEKDRAECFYARALERFRSSPGLALQGGLVGLEYYRTAMFGFIDETSTHVWRGERLSDGYALPPVVFLAGLAVLAAAWRRDDPHLLQLLLVGLAIIACSPLLADGGSRVYAATLPYTVALPAVGLGFPWRRRPEGAGGTVEPAVLWIGGALTLLCVLGPTVAVRLELRPRFGPPRCAPGLRPVIFGLERGSIGMRILAGGPRTRVSELSREDWRDRPRFADNEAAPVWRKVHEGDYVVHAYDYTPWRRDIERSWWLVVPAGLEVPEGDVSLKACVRQDDRVAPFPVWRAKALEAVTPIAWVRAARR